MKQFEPCKKELYKPNEDGLGIGNIDKQTFIYSFDETCSL
jgi:hypothetical protein